MDKSKKYKERSTKHTYKTKDRVTRTPLKTYNTMDKSKKYKQRSTKHKDKTKDRVTRTPLKTMCIRYHVHIRINTRNDI